jgi:hypothetical protein
VRVVSCALTGLAALALAGCGPHPSQDPTSSPQPGQQVVLLPYPPDGGAVDWDDWAGTFVADYCVQCHNPGAPCLGSGCHTAGQLPDFRQQSDVVSFALTIRCGISVQQDPSWGCGGTAPETFPINSGSNPFPTDEQRDIVVGWIDAGCP